MTFPHSLQRQTKFYQSISQLLYHIFLTVNLVFLLFNHIIQKSCQYRYPYGHDTEALSAKKYFTMLSYVWEHLIYVTYESIVKCSVCILLWAHISYAHFHMLCMQVKKQQLELDVEQQTSSKLGKEYVKVVYCHPGYLTYIQSTSWEMLGWRKHELVSGLPGEISITSDRQRTPPLWQKVKN